jgi:hypothetical protein
MITGKEQFWKTIVMETIKCQSPNMKWNLKRYLIKWLKEKDLQVENRFQMC